MKLKETDEKTIKLLYQLFYDTHQIFVNNRFKYWAISGTFLGMVRHKGIIPWDDDGDIGILQSDEKRFLEIIPDFEKCGYSIVKHWVGYKIFYTKIKSKIGEDYSYPFIDVFVFKPYPDIKKGRVLYRSTSKKARSIWPQEYFLESDIKQLKLYKFGDFQIYGPNTWENYFTNMYGDDWNNVAYRQYDHEQEEEVESVKVKLTKEMRKPAKPTQVKERPCVKMLCRKSPDKRNPLYWMEDIKTSCPKNVNKCFNNFKNNDTQENFKILTMVINCKNLHQERMAKFQKFAKKANLEVCTIPCVEGGKFKEDTVCNMTEQGILSKKSDMNKVEVSINMSHYNAWVKLLNSCQNYALIFEDDVEVHKNFIDKLNVILTVMEDDGIEFSILQLWDGIWDEDKKIRKKVLDIWDDDGEKIIIQEIQESYNSGAVCYMIHRDYAEYLVKKMFPIKYPQDIMMGTWVNKKFKHYAIKMKFCKDEGCWKSPILDMECGGDGGTGKTTQTYGAPTIKQYKCDRCQR